MIISQKMNQSIVRLSRIEALQDENAFLPNDVVRNMLDTSSSNKEGVRGSGRVNVRRVLEESRKAVAKPSDGPTFVAATMAPSRLPGRKLCSVCGYAGPYTCVKCKTRYCSISCKGKHDDTRCLKFLA